MSLGALGLAEVEPAAAPARHDLLSVDPAGWPAVLATLGDAARLSPAGSALLRGWAEAGWPVIARRPAPGDATDAVPVGLPLPPGVGKSRVALAIPASVPWRALLPVTLAEAAPAAPALWQDTIADLLGLARALGLVPRVFGALLWQSATGLDYLGPGSDLDLLWPVRDAEPIGPLLDGLERIAARAPMPIDGEVLTAAGGVQWRELAAARRGDSKVVLAKGIRRAGFVRAATLLGSEAMTCP